jgi:superfamily II DNA helicase RecQ
LLAYAFFKIPCGPEPGAAQVLNDFLKSHSVLAVEKQWVTAGDASFWAFCVQYQETGVPQGGRPGGGGGAKVDYKEVLTDEQFRLFVKLREVRKQLAEREGMPVFAVFTNEQLAEMVKKSVRTAEELRGIPGVGEARVEKYGREILALMNSDAPGQATV